MSDVLKPHDLNNFDEKGFVVIQKAVKPSLASELAQIMLDYQKRNYRFSIDSKDDYKGGIIKMFHHPLQWQLRQSPTIYGAFSQLLKDKHLWVSFGRGKLVPPSSYQGTLQKGFLHWDIDTNNPPDPIPLQGLIALTDTAYGQGGFQCVPGFHKKFWEWKKQKSISSNTFSDSLEGFEAIPIEMKAGDLIIWNALLPHGNSKNLSEIPRLAQLITMYPCKLYDNSTLNKRLEMFKKKDPNNPLNPYESHWGEVNLSRLGKKLLGISKW